MLIGTFQKTRPLNKPQTPSDSPPGEKASTGPADCYERQAGETPPCYTLQSLPPTELQSSEESIRKIQAQLQREWEFFDHQAYDAEGNLIKRGYSEEQDQVFKRVGYFWETGTGFELDGRDREWPWSAAFISAVHQDAGVGPQFLRSPAHAKYIRDAILKKKAGIESAAYWGFRLTERAPQVGDMVCYSRQKGVDYDRQPERYKSHADIVTAVRPGEIDVIGGNVGQSVSKRTLRTDEDGLLIDQSQNWFAVLAPQDLSSTSIPPAPVPETKEPEYAG